MNLGLLLLRVVIGLTLAAHGSQKLFGWFGGGGIAGTGAFFESRLNFRPGRVHATMAGLSEFCGGLGLAIGLLTPLAAAAVVGVMLVAGWAGHRTSGFFITKGGYEYTVVLGGAAAALAFTGPGHVSIDHALGWNLSGAVWGFVALLFGLVAGACVLAGQGRAVEEAAPAPSTQHQAQAQSQAQPGTVAGGRESGLQRSQSPAPTDADADA
jgi:putative oxidoreductase